MHFRRMNAHELLMVDKLVVLIFAVFKPRSSLSRTCETLANSAAHLPNVILQIFVKWTGANYSAWTELLPVA